MAPVTAPQALIDSLSDRITGMLTVARALAEMRRPIDLTGLDDAVGRLCAACLDLPPEAGRELRPRLWRLLAELDALAHACRAGIEE